MAGELIRTAVDNALLDPLQGFDIDIYVQDQGSGSQLMVGSFTSFQYTMRNATEPYLEFNQRIPRLLDGEMQFGFVLERGLVDVDIISQTFGYDVLSRAYRIGRSPRHQITVIMNARELQEADTNGASNNNTNTFSWGANTNKGLQGVTRRVATGKHILTYAKIDSLTLGMMAGRSVVATRWEGLCEGITHQNLGVNDTKRDTILSDVYGSTNSAQSVTSPQAPLTFPAIDGAGGLANWSDIVKGGSGSAQSPS